ncbi:MAG: DUF1292 domain-containing protein [Tissierellia bacterium]|jgi:uncharacterized protein YrzB (UPF0473 family)|nr:DUF1292 domain-containing protein [Bacillota bacterium]NLK58524.1 DUF1292 domain-containing protein [Tissierellia bacterium]
MSLIELYDESGNRQSFRILDVFGMDDQDYAVLLPENNHNDQTYILRIEIDENGQQYFAGIDDEEELEDAIRIYEELKNDMLQ